MGEPAPEFRDSESSNNTANNNNRYTQVENDVLFNPVEGYNDENEEEKQEDKDNNKNNNNKSEVKTSSNSKKNKKIKKLKIILVGEKEVGKSSLINRYVNGKFFFFNNSSNESDVKIKNLDLDENLCAELSIYDPMHEEKLGKITKNYYKDAHGALVVFDLTKKVTFNKVNFWLKEIKSNAPKDIILCLLGNKSDLTYDREVDYEKAKALADDNLYYEVSAKTGNNISLAFEQLTYGIIEKQNEEEGNPEKVQRGKEGRKTVDLNDINEIDKDLKRTKKCC